MDVFDTWHPRSPANRIPDMSSAREWNRSATSGIYRPRSEKAVRFPVENHMPDARVCT